MNTLPPQPMFPVAQLVPSDRTLHSPNQSNGIDKLPAQPMSPVAQLVPPARRGKRATRGKKNKINTCYSMWSLWHAMSGAMWYKIQDYEQHRSWQLFQLVALGLCWHIFRKCRGVGNGMDMCELHTTLTGLQQYLALVMPFDWLMTQFDH